MPELRGSTSISWLTSGQVDRGDKVPGDYRRLPQNERPYGDALMERLADDIYHEYKVRVTMYNDKGEEKLSRALFFSWEPISPTATIPGGSYEKRLKKQGFRFEIYFSLLLRE